MSMIKSNQPIKNIIKSQGLIFMQIHPIFTQVNLEFALFFIFRSFEVTIKFPILSKILV
jgi:hypothetical protein